MAEGKQSRAATFGGLRWGKVQGLCKEAGNFAAAAAAAGTSGPRAEPHSVKEMAALCRFPPPTLFFLSHPLGTSFRELLSQSPQPVWLYQQAFLVSNIPRPESKVRVLEGWSLLRTVRQLLPHLSPSFWWPAGSPWHSLACRHATPVCFLPCWGVYSNIPFLYGHQSCGFEDPL